MRVRITVGTIGGPTETHVAEQASYAEVMADVSTQLPDGWRVLAVVVEPEAASPTEAASPIDEWLQAQQARQSRQAEQSEEFEQSSKRRMRLGRLIQRGRQASDGSDTA